jgi:CRISPR-associated endonuclease/helicase Cas3
MTTYYAHSSPSPDKSNWQPLSEHLNNVGAIAASCAAHFSDYAVKVDGDVLKQYRKDVEVV